jgi:hypothetical protein
LPRSSRSRTVGAIRCEFFGLASHANVSLVIREDQFLNAIWPQVSEIHDLHLGLTHGTFFTVKNQLLNLAERFTPPKLKKKKS